MRAGAPQKDLIVLAADENTRLALAGLLSRPDALGIRSVTSQIYVHPERDPGCCLRGEDFLRPFANQYAHVLLIFDRHGCGREASSRETIETEVENRLSRSGWDKRAAVIVLDPELEVWVWTDSPHVDSVLGWSGNRPDMRTWLNERGYLGTGRAKPDRPKEALEEVLRLVQKPRSSSLYRKLAEVVTLERCADPAFAKFRSTLRGWFSREETGR